MPGDAEVPLAWMPPGSNVSPLPSEDEIFPPQTVPLRFNHKKHVKGLSLSCKVCHEGAYTSAGSLGPAPPAPHRDLRQLPRRRSRHPGHVRAGKSAMGQCAFCHVGAEAGEAGKVSPVIVPAPNLRFPHAKHLARNIQCG